MSLNILMFQFRVSGEREGTVNDGRYSVQLLLGTVIQIQHYRFKYGVKNDRQAVRAVGVRGGGREGPAR